MCAPDFPDPPNPRDTSAAQTGTNVASSIANTQQGQVSRVTPEGTLSYDQSGNYVFNDPYTGQSYDIPTYTATETLNPTAQAIFDTNQQGKLSFANAAANQAANVQDHLSQPFTPDTAAIEGRLAELMDERAAPRFAKDEAALRTMLANKGISEGTDAWNSEMENLHQAKNDAYNQMYLGGRGQALSEMYQERNQPINEITALLTGSQVSPANFPIASPAGIPTTDVAGIINNEYGQRVNQAQAESDYNNQLLGGLFGAGGTLLGMPVGGAYGGSVFGNLFA